MTEDSKIKILLVDDDKFLLDMYSLKFKKSGIDIDTFSSSTVALDKIREVNDYNLILLDIIMPGMDRIEILKKIREEKLVPGAKIVMLTNQAEEIEKAKELGVSGYIIKATTIPSEVVEKVVEIFKK
ncbi:MAG TPA: response regulator [Candidatus Paceibacterota bacterium]